MKQFKQCGKEEPPHQQNLNPFSGIGNGSDPFALKDIEHSTVPWISLPCFSCSSCRSAGRDDQI